MTKPYCRAQPRHHHLRQRRANEPNPTRHDPSSNRHHRLRRHRQLRPHLHKHPHRPHRSGRRTLNSPHSRRLLNRHHHNGSHSSIKLPAPPSKCSSCSKTTIERIHTKTDMHHEVRKMTAVRLRKSPCYKRPFFRKQALDAMS
jgi:hypothetical protein